MARRAARRRSFRHLVNCELELRPLMNVFIVLIPMLLMSAVFMEIRVIEMTLPRAAEAAETPAEAPFDLAIRITTDAYVVESNDTALQTVPRAAADASRGAAEASAAVLTRVLADVVAAHPGHTDVRIVAFPSTRYQDVVSVMDAARAAGLTDPALEGAMMEAR